MLLTYMKYQGLIRYLWQQARQTAALKQMLTCRNLMCLILMWVTRCCGHDCDRLWLVDVRDPTYLRQPSPERVFSPTTSLTAGVP